MTRARSLAPAPGRHDRGAGTRPGLPRPRRSRSAGTRECLAMVRAFAQLYLEVEAGLRAPALVYPLMDSGLVQRLSGCWVRGGPPGRVRHVHGRLVGSRRFDAVVVVERGARAGALAVVLARDELGWRVAEAGCPEHHAGPGAAPTLLALSAS